MSLIRLSGISKSYPDGVGRENHVLREITMNIPKGDFVAIMGTSGCGKTTLLLILGTLLQPNSGSYLFDGKEILTAGVDHSAVRNRNIGFVFQEHNLMPQLSVLDNILLPTLAFTDKPTAEQIEYARKLMEITEITTIAKQFPSTISGGEAGRTALCRALIMKPLLVLADEPTGQLDADNSKKIIELLSFINQELKTTILMVTHSQTVASSAKRILTLKDGALL